jgi:acyl-lipid omega-6 desaturase (Delta-12 desaturase)
MTPSAAHPSNIDWRSICETYRTADDGLATRKLLVNLSALALTWAAMVWALSSSHGTIPWTVIPLGVVSGLLFNQLFLFQHDMGHGAFFTTAKKNQVVGMWICVLMLTPFLEWTRSHAHHHRNVAHLDRRVLGDIYTMTVSEWHNAGVWKRLGYRLFRSPVTLMGFVPLYYFFVANRIKGSVSPGFPRGRSLVNLWATTFGFIGFAAAMSWLIGFRTFVIIELATLIPGGAVGLWIFYMGHSFEHTWYAREQTGWSHEEAALRGASFCVMPRALGWLFADIGFHHVHHLDARIPSYRLRACHEENPAVFGQVKPLSLASAVYGIFWLSLYDEDKERLVSFHTAAIRGAANTL